MFKFSIRDVLWLMLVIGLTIGWWLDRGRLIRAYVERFVHEDVREHCNYYKHRNLPDAFP